MIHFEDKDVFNIVYSPVRLQCLKWSHLYLKLRNKTFFHDFLYPLSKKIYTKRFNIGGGYLRLILEYYVTVFLNTGLRRNRKDYYITKLYRNRGSMVLKLKLPSHIYFRTKLYSFDITFRCKDLPCARVSSRV